MKTDFVKEIQKILNDNLISAYVYDTILNGNSSIAIEPVGENSADIHNKIDNLLTGRGFNHIENHITKFVGEHYYAGVHYFDSTKFRSVDYDSEIHARDLMRQLKIILDECPDAVVTIRQTTGTDFPPFLTIESRFEHDKQDESGCFQNMWA
jgi:hypothetical protein